MLESTSSQINDLLGSAWFPCSLLIASPSLHRKSIRAIWTFIAVIAVGAVSPKLNDIGLDLGCNRMQLSDQLTIVITSSAIPSNPSTAVLEVVLNGFHCVPGLNSCPIVLVFDGYLISASSDSQFKRMRLGSESAARYAEYRSRASRLLRDFLGIGPHTAPITTTYGSRIGAYQTADVHAEAYVQEGCPSLHILTLSTRFGFALAVREALQQYVALVALSMGQFD